MSRPLHIAAAQYPQTEFAGLADYEAKIKLKADKSGIVTDGVNMIMNPFDEIGVEEALRQKEKHTGEVVVVTIGTTDSIAQLRSALAMGADRAILVVAEDVEPLAVAKILAKGIPEAVASSRPVFLPRVPLEGASRRGLANVSIRLVAAPGAARD